MAGRERARGIDLIAAALLCSALQACSVEKVDSLAKVCGRHNGHTSDVVSFDGEAVRNDITSQINTAYLSKVDGRAKQMAWRTGKVLHIYALSNLFELPAEKEIAEWTANLSETPPKQTPEAECLFSAIGSYFDGVALSFSEKDAAGDNTAREHPVNITTWRGRHANTPNLP